LRDDAGKSAEQGATASGEEVLAFAADGDDLHRLSIGPFVLEDHFRAAANDVGIQ